MNTRGAETAMADQPSNETPALDEDLKDLAARAISQPLVTHIYTADPSAHVFEGKLYVYCSHDIEGGVAFNDVVMQVSSRRLPFGGVGASGMGRYHGEASFECFSNCRSYFLGSKRFDLPLRYAPYPKRLIGWLRRLMD